MQKITSEEEFKKAFDYTLPENSGYLLRIGSAVLPYKGCDHSTSTICQCCGTTHYTDAVKLLRDYGPIVGRKYGRLIYHELVPKGEKSKGPERDGRLIIPDVSGDSMHLTWLLESHKQTAVPKNEEEEDEE